jgi:hypothetical protein
MWASLWFFLLPKAVAVLKVVEQQLDRAFKCIDQLGSPSLTGDKGNFIKLESTKNQFNRDITDVSNRFYIRSLKFRIAQI